MLPSKWNADDGQTEQQAEKKMRKCHPYPAKHNPEDIHERIQASGAGRRIGDHRAKRHQRRNSQLKKLYTKRDANDGQAEHYPADKVFQKNEKTTENDPDKIAYKIHYDEDKSMSNAVSSIFRCSPVCIFFKESSPLWISSSPIRMT